MKHLTFILFFISLQVNLFANNDKDTIDTNELKTTSMLEITKNSIVLSWKTPTTNNCIGFEIERSNNKKNWSKIGFIEYNDNTTNYQFTDNSKRSKSTYYKIHQISTNGSKKVIAELEDIVQALAFSMSSNPVGNYLMMNNSQGLITIYDANSKIIKQIRTREASVTLDMSDLAQGQYIFHLERTDATTISRLILKN